MGRGETFSSASADAIKIEATLNPATINALNSALLKVSSGHLDLTAAGRMALRPGALFVAAIAVIAESSHRIDLSQRMWMELAADHFGMDSA